MLEFNQKKSTILDFSDSASIPSSKCPCQQITLDIICTIFGRPSCAHINLNMWISKRKSPRLRFLTDRGLKCKCIGTLTQSIPCTFTHDLTPVLEVIIHVSTEHYVDAWPGKSVTISLLPFSPSRRSLKMTPARCVSHKEKILVVFFKFHKVAVFFSCGICEFAKISHWNSEKCLWDC